MPPLPDNDSVKDLRRHYEVVIIVFPLTYRKQLINLTILINLPTHKSRRESRAGQVLTIASLSYAECKGLHHLTALRKSTLLTRLNCPSCVSKAGVTQMISGSHLPVTSAASNQRQQQAQPRPVGGRKRLKGAAATATHHCILFILSFSRLY